MQGALERTEENQYHLYNVDGAGDEINELARVQIIPYMPKKLITAYKIAALRCCLQYIFT